MLVALASRDVEFVACHEFFHSLLDLRHANGLHGFADAASVMAVDQIAHPIEGSYLSPWQKCLCLTSTRVQRLVDVGRRLEGLARPERALRVYEQALEEDPFHLMLHEKVAGLLVQERRVHEALSVLRRGGRLNPRLMFTAAELLFRLGRVREGRQVLRETCQCRCAAQPTVVARDRAYLGVLAAQACQRSALCHEAVRWYRRALKIDVRPWFHASLGTAFHTLGNLERASRHYVTSLEMGYAGAPAHWLLASIRVIQGRHRAARRHIRAAMALKEDTKTGPYPWRVSLEKARGRYDVVRRLWARAVAACPHDPDPRRSLGFVRLGAGDREGARREFLRYLRLVPRAYVEAQSIRALLLWMRGTDPMQAIRRSRRLLMRFSGLVAPLYVLSEAFPGSLYERWLHHPTRPESARRDHRKDTAAFTPRAADPLP